MAAYTSLLLVIAVCATAAFSLRCYTCETQTSNSNCLTATTCTSTAAYCMTSVISDSKITYVTKRCQDVCQSLTGTVNGVTSSTTCCSSDLCNTSGGISIKSSYTAIILALGSVLIILKSSVL
ncbi:lymphocyte antigen 6E-like [Dendropsophus ebraccatus]|uniref:lymphocyte antigen 6E-like n=1 Tax=Dendropsophus ebraccatus TaxID=150705 RepID=UPI003831C666